VTWGAFKQQVEAKGVKDGDKVFFVDVVFTKDDVPLTVEWNAEIGDWSIYQ